MQDLLDHLSKDHPEGLILYISGSITITTIQIINRLEFKKGLKGKNELWESPEIILYLFCWIFPHVLMVDQFLQMKLSTEGWFFMGVLLLFGLTGRWGLEWLATIRTGKQIEKDELPK